MQSIMHTLSIYDMLNTGGEYLGSKDKKILSLDELNLLGPEIDPFQS